MHKFKTFLFKRDYWMLSSFNRRKLFLKKIILMRLKERNAAFPFKLTFENLVKFNNKTNYIFNLIKLKFCFQ